MVRGLLTLLPLVAGLRSAAASPVKLEVDGGMCDFGTLESEITQIVGSDPVDSSAQASVHIAVTKLRDKWEARVTFDDGGGDARGPRIVTSAKCIDLIESVAVVVAMALPDLSAPPTVTASPPKTQTSEQSPPAPVAAATVSPGLAADTTPDSLHVTIRDSSSRSVGRYRTDFFAGGGGGLTSGGVRGQLTLGIRVQKSSTSLTAEMRADAPEDHALQGMASINVFRSQLSISPCLHIGSAAGCVVTSAGTIHGSAIGLTSARSAYTLLVAGGLRATWEHRLVGGVGLRLHLDADALLTTTQFDVDNMKVWVSPRFEGAAGIGVIARFP